MAKHILPGLGLTGGFADGEDGWGTDMNANLAKMSAIGSGTVKGRVAAVPAAPAQGDIYILTADDTVAVYDTAWTYYVPQEGWLFYDRDADVFVNFNGADWVVLETGGGGGGGLPEAPKDGKLYGRKDGAWAEVTGGGGGGSGTAGGLKFRYARFLNITNYSDGASAREIQFKNNGVQLAAPTVVSQNASSEYPFPRAFDGDLTNFFSTYGVGTNFVGVLDFGGMVEVDEMVWLSRTDSYQQAPAKIEFQYSMDGKIYQSVTILYDLAGWTQGGAARSVSFEGLGQSSGGGGGGSGGSAAAPQIVQKAYGRSNGAAYNVALPAAPKVGNMLVLMLEGRYLGSPDGYSNLSYRSFSTVATAIWMRVVEAGDTGVVALPSTSDWNGAALYEITPPVGVDVYAGDTGNNNNFGQTVFPAVGKPSLALLICTTDSAQTQTYTGGGTVKDNYYLGGDGGNHTGQSIAVEISKVEKVSGSYSGGQDRQAWCMAVFG